RSKSFLLLNAKIMIPIFVSFRDKRALSCDTFPEENPQQTLPKTIKCFTFFYFYFQKNKTMYKCRVVGPEAIYKQSINMFWGNMFPPIKYIMKETEIDVILSRCSYWDKKSEDTKANVEQAHKNNILYDPFIYYIFIFVMIISACFICYKLWFYKARRYLSCM
ncbi:hypothetical protein CDIK_4196, partial [Cucumispora dikerogammari]